MATLQQQTAQTGTRGRPAQASHHGWRASCGTDYCRPGEVGHCPSPPGFCPRPPQCDTAASPMLPPPFHTYAERYAGRHGPGISATGTEAFAPLWNERHQLAVSLSSPWVLLLLLLWLALRCLTLAKAAECLPFEPGNVRKRAHGLICRPSCHLGALAAPPPARNADDTKGRQMLMLLDSGKHCLKKKKCCQVVATLMERATPAFCP